MPILSAHFHWRYLILITLILFAALLTSQLRAGDWNQWRGGDRQGNSESSAGPIFWSRDTNVKWRVAVPGEGYSSPIISGDSVYVTTAREIKENRILLKSIRLFQLILVLVFLWYGTAYIVRRCANSKDARSLTSTSVFVLLLLVTSGIVLYGESVFKFTSAPERAWLASVLAGSLLLFLSVYEQASRPRTALLGSISLFLLSIATAAFIPDLAHTIVENPLSYVSKMIYATIAMPGLLGLSLLMQFVRYRGPTATGHLLTIIQWLITVIAFCLLPLLAIIVGMKEDRTVMISIAETYKPHITWWMVSLLTALLLILMAVRQRIRNVIALKIAVIVTATAFFAVIIAVMAEQSVAHFSYLAYLVGTASVKPMLGWISPIMLLVVLIASLIFTLMLEKKHPITRESYLPTGLLLSAVVLAGIFFIYANFIPKKPRLERAIVSIDRDTGAIKWISRGLLGARGELSPENSPATPTPVTDGKRVYGYFGTPGVLCTDTRGKWLWTYRKLPFESREGVASSPVLVDGKLVILSESDKGCYIAALDADTGKLLWKTDRKKKTHSYAGNCRTPSLVNIQGNKTIVTWGLEDISGYDPLTGRETWSLAIGDFGTGGNPVACAVYSGSYVYLAGPARTMCLDIDKMQADKPTIIWEKPAVDGAQCASPIIQNGLLFAVSDNGNVYCTDASTGANVWSHNLSAQHYSSIVSIGEKVYLTNTRGYTTIIACDHRYRKLGEADLHEPIFASFAPVDGDLFIRTKTQLYRVH